MTETKEVTEKTLRGAAPRKPLSLKRTVDAGHVKQSFSHGRSKSVVVEKKKKRTIAAPGGADAENAEVEEAERLLAEVMQRPGGLSTDELDARRRALEAAKERAEAEAAERARLEALRPPQPEPVLEPEPEKTEEPVPPAIEPREELVEPDVVPSKPPADKARPGEKAKGVEAPRQIAKRGARALEVEAEAEEEIARQEEGCQAAQESRQDRR